MSGNHSNSGIVEIGQNTKKSPGDLTRLAVTQTLVKDHQLTLVWKTQMRKKNLIQARKKITCHLLNFAFPPDNRLKIRKSEKIEKYLDFARELKEILKKTNQPTKQMTTKNSNMRVTFGTVPKNLEKRLG